MKSIKILVLVRKFGDLYPKHKHLYDSITSLKKHAHVQFWHDDGDIEDIMSTLNFTPDFIYQYDTTWGYQLTPNITGLDKVSIPKGCHVIDNYHGQTARRRYIDSNRIDLIFSPYKAPFLRSHPEYWDKLRWIPFSINPSVIKDWHFDKEIDFLLLGLFYYKDKENPPKQVPPKGKYTFREAVYNKMKGTSGFVFIPHPGHNTKATKNTIINENYGKIINKAKMLFTCGSVLEYPIAKFFEVPGCRTLLLAKPNPDILELGFQDNVNFVACDEDNFYEKAMYFLNNAKERNRICDNGYQFVHQYHTNDVRALQIIHYMEDFIKNKDSI